MPGQAGEGKPNPPQHFGELLSFPLSRKLGEFSLCVFYDKAFAFRLAGLQEGVETATRMHTLG